jgi:hypothetical protein
MDKFILGGGGGIEWWRVWGEGLDLEGESSI